MSSELEAAVTAKYEFDPAKPGQGEVRNINSKTASFSLPLRVVWKNITILRLVRYGNVPLPSAGAHFHVFQSYGNRYIHND